MSVLQSRSVNLPTPSGAEKNSHTKSAIPSPHTEEIKSSERKLRETRVGSEKELCTRNQRGKKNSSSFQQCASALENRGVPSELYLCDPSQCISNVELTAAQYYYYYYYYYYPAMIASAQSTSANMSEPVPAVPYLSSSTVPDFSSLPYVYGDGGSGVSSSAGPPFPTQLNVADNIFPFPWAANPSATGSPNPAQYTPQHPVIPPFPIAMSTSVCSHSPQPFQAAHAYPVTTHKSRPCSALQPPNFCGPEVSCSSGPSHNSGFHRSGSGTDDTNQKFERVQTPTFIPEKPLDLFTDSVPQTRQSNNQTSKNFSSPEEECHPAITEEKPRNNSSNPTEPSELHGGDDIENDVLEMLESCRGHILDLARTEDGKLKLQQLIRSARCLGTVCSTHGVKKTIFEANENYEGEFSATLNETVPGANVVLAQCVRLILTELSTDLSNAGLDENACHILRAAIAHCHDIPFVHELIVKKLSDTTILNWCTATHYSRGIIETLFAKERSAMALIAGNTASSATSQTVSTNGSLVSRVLEVMRRNTTYLAVMQQGCICFTHCYGKYCSREQQREWLLERGANDNNDEILEDHESKNVLFSHFLCPLLKDLSLDCYGNYTVQCLLRDTLDKRLIRMCARNFLLPHLVTMSLHKHGSNVVETLIKHLAAPLLLRPFEIESNGATRKNSCVKGRHLIIPLEDKEQQDILMLRQDILITFGLLLSNVKGDMDEECSAKNAVLDTVICNSYGNFVVQAILTYLFPLHHLMSLHLSAAPPESLCGPTKAKPFKSKCKEDNDFMSLHDSHRAEGFAILQEWPIVCQRCSEALARSGCPYTAKLDRLLHR